MRLVDKPVNIVFVLDGLPLALWLRLALLAHVNSVAFTRKLLVRPFAPADPAVMPHPGFLPATQKIIAILPYDTSAMREQGHLEATLVFRSCRRLGMVPVWTAQDNKHP